MVYTVDNMTPQYILGIRPDGTFRDSLSYSGWMLWKSDKAGYRRRYYENEKPFETVETIYGKRIAEMFEFSHADVSHVKMYEKMEHTIDIEIDGEKLNGRIDSFCPHTFSFLDVKTGHANKEGKPPWNKLKVEKLKQLDFYSMLIKKKYGKVNNVCKLVWLETDFLTKTTEFAGHTLTAQTRELKLTGKVETFSRTILQWQRDKIEQEVLQAIKDIHEDYKNYKQIHERDGKTVAQEVATI